MEKKVPSMKLRLGTLFLTVWNNATADGRTFDSINIERRYKAKDSDEWKTANDFNTQDIGNLITLLQKYNESKIVDHTMN